MGNISRQLMCHMRWRPLHRPRAGWPLMTAPQLVRVASIASVTRWQGAPSTRPWDKNQGFLHMSKARRHRRMTLIMQSGFPLGENPLVLSHHCSYLMYSRPKGIMLVSADIRPSSFWNCLTVSDRPSLTLLTDVRIDSSRGHTCLHRIPHDAQISGSPCWRNTLFLALSLNPISFVWARTSSRCHPLWWANINHSRRGWVCGCPRVTEEPAQYSHTSWKYRVRVQGQREEPNIDTLCHRSTPQVLPVMGKDGDGKYASFRSLMNNQSSDLVWDTRPDRREHPELQSHDWAIQLTSM